MTQVVAKQSRKYLIKIRVDIDQNGIPNYQYGEELSNTKLTDKILEGVETGDLLGWRLLAYIKNSRALLPFRISFESDELLGVREVDVPTGGTSPFFPVKAHRQSLKRIFEYTVALPTVQVAPDDPEVQMDSVRDLADNSTTTKQKYVIMASLSGGVFTVDYKIGSGTPTTLPAEISVNPGDKITWTFHRTDQPASFDVQFKVRQDGLPKPVLGDDDNPTIHVTAPHGENDTSTEEWEVRKRIGDEAPVFKYSLLTSGAESGEFGIKIT